MKRILIGALLVLGLLAGGMAAPAAADANGVGVLVNGIAKVGSSMTPACDKDVDGTETISGDGIYLPINGVPPAPNNPNKDRKYLIQVPSDQGFATNIASALLVVDDDNQVLEAKPLRICGNVTKVFGGQGTKLGPETQLGPWCGMSKGYNGKGKVKLYNEDQELKYWLNIYDLGWKFSWGGFLPLIGKYQEQDFNGPSAPGAKDETKKSKEAKWGQILGLVNARSLLPEQVEQIPGANTCANAGVNAGLPTPFHVDGVLVLRNSGTSKNDVPYRWNDDWTEGLPGRPDPDKDNNDSPLFCKGSADLNNSAGDGKEYKCPYKTKPKDKPKTG